MMQSGLTIAIKLQSFGDVITNSSSEVFCTISSVNIEHILEILEPIFAGCDEDIDPTLDYYKAGEYEYDLDEYNEQPFIQIRLPHGTLCYQLYKEGIESILDKYIGKNNYTIVYDS